MERFEKLANAGIDMDSLTKRLMGNTSLISIFIRKFIEDQNYARLRQAFADEDAAAAEMASHTLKGMCGNLSLTELYGLFTEQVNLLRRGEYDKAARMMGTISVVYDKAVLHMQQWLLG